ncbi:MAG: hypothetical protein EZS28_002580 [Streblomastix strix]|uniref:Uncharacterized protein n=1 Tax=Streblomastix strix TaxID=222440 RepID=A0A5J4X560_9EUKA|nr:MAG: hypothetical protein EZS28_002580 [Streblomastix strix]
MERINIMENHQIRNFTLNKQMLNTQGEGNSLRKGSNLQGFTAKSGSNNVLLDTKSLYDNMNLEDMQYKRPQTQLSSYETMNHDMIYDQNWITAGNTFLNQYIMENVDTTSTLLQGSLVGTEGTIGSGLEKCSESSPHNVARKSSRHIEQNYQTILKQQTIRLMEKFEQFDPTILLKKCELEPKQEIAREVLVDQQDIRKQGTLFDIECFSSDSYYRCSHSGLRNGNGIENGRSSYSMRHLKERRK